jgi:hypothetical protein
MWDKLRDWWWPKPPTWRDKLRDWAGAALAVAMLATIWWVCASLTVLANNTIESAVAAFWGALWRWIHG